MSGARGQLPAVLDERGHEAERGGHVGPRRALQARVDGASVDLTARQFQILWALANRAGRVLDRAQLSAAIGEGSGDPLDRTIDVHISRIRAAIEPDPRRPRYLKTVRGVGYLFVDSAE